MDNYQRFNNVHEMEKTCNISTPNTTRDGFLNSSEVDANCETKRVRLRAVETETEYFLRLLNVTVIKRLVCVQIGASICVLITQLILYGIVSDRSYKILDFTGIGIWAPLFIFFVACGLSFMTFKSPTGCLIGTAMAFQIASAVVGSFLTLLAVVSLMMHGRSTYNHEDDTYEYDPEVAGRLMCSLLIISTIVFIVTSFFTSIQFCKATCCGRQRGGEVYMFDVETHKV